ncbi:MAG TPA: glycosyltransferase family 39 protein [Polyangia bacterium]|nr:glycosyltransferase family 39 protein [Polyangia bacterium]
MASPEQEPGGPGPTSWAARLRQPRARTAIRIAALTVIVLVAAVRVGRTWSVFSATADEPQHIAAGVEWLGRTDVVQHQPWRTVNPPLARIAVGIGPYLAGMQSTPFLREALYTGPGYVRNLVLARRGVLPFLALVIILTWILARRAYGEAPAWIAAVAISCAPAVLGHGGLATTDVPFTATFLLSLLTLLRWIEQPTRGRAIVAGLALGLATATKYSAIVLVVLAVVAMAARRSLGPRPGALRRMLALAPLAALGAFVVLWGAYRFAVAAPATLWQPEWLQDTVGACFPSERGRHAASWLLAHRLPAPSAFLAAVGLCAQEAPGRSTAYLLGHLTQNGFPAFFPIALAVKVPLPLGALAAVGFFAAVFGKGPAETRFRTLAPLIAIIVYLAMVIPSRTNIGVRHVLPVFPLLAALAGHGAVTLWRTVRWRIGARAAVVAAMIWVLAIPFAAAPDYFPWFNALAGRRPERILIDSDLDWGQDLLRLERELADRRIDRVWIAYFGASEICRHSLPHLTWLRPGQPVHGWIAISQTFRHGIEGTYYRDGNPCDRSQFVETFRPDTDQYAWLDAYQPVARVGSSILLYDIP